MGRPILINLLEDLLMTAGNQFISQLFRALSANQPLGYLLRYFWSVAKISLPFMLLGLFLTPFLGEHAMWLVIIGMVIAFAYTFYCEDRDMAAALQNTEISRACELPALLKRLGMEPCHNDRLPKVIQSQFRALDVSGRYAVTDKISEQTNCYIKWYSNGIVALTDHRFSETSQEPVGQDAWCTVLLIKSNLLRLKRFSIHPKLSNGNFIWDYLYGARKMVRIKRPRLIVKSHAVRLAKGEDPHRLPFTELGLYFSKRPGLHAEGLGSTLAIYTEDRSQIEPCLNISLNYNGIVPPAGLKQLLHDGQELLAILSGGGRLKEKKPAADKET